MRTRVGLTKNKWGFGVVAIEVIAKTSGKWDVIWYHKYAQSGHIRKNIGMTQHSKQLWSAIPSCDPNQIFDFSISYHWRLPRQWFESGWWFVTWLLFAIYWEFHHPNWLSCFSEDELWVTRNQHVSPHWDRFSSPKWPPPVGFDNGEIPQDQWFVIERKHWGWGMQ